ncbi:MAG: TolB family protein, partial [Vicinamibacterales bacterium]
MKPRSWGVGLGLCCVLSAPAAAQTTRVSVASGGGQSAGAGAWSRQAAVSADGRYVAFESLALNLVAGDTNGRQDVFVHDRVLNITTRVSVGPAGLQADSGSETPAISADGRFVAFVSSASNLVPGDTNSAADVFVHDRISGQTTRVSVATGGAQAMKSSVMPALTADGRYVAFTSDANTLVAGDTNNQGDIFVHDRVSKVTTRVSVATGGAQGNLSSHTPVISGTGCLVAFVSAASNLVPGDTNGVEDVFVHDCATGVTTRVSVATGGGQSDGPAASSGYPSISADGRYVAFQSLASNLVERDTNGASDVFVHDRATTTTTRVSVSTGGDQAADFSTTPSMSGDGRYVAFVSTATNLVLGDTNGVVDVFLHDRVTSTTRRVSVATGGTQGLFTKDNNGNPVGSSTPSVSGDGRYVAFESWSFNLVDGDTNAVPDVFLHDARMYQRQRVNVSTAGVQAEGGAGGNGSPAASADGRFLAFGTNAPNLVSGDTNNAYDVFVRDRVANV